MPILGDTKDTCRDKVYNTKNNVKSVEDYISMPLGEEDLVYEEQKIELKEPYEARQMGIEKTIQEYKNSRSLVCYEAGGMVRNTKLSAFNIDPKEGQRPSVFPVSYSFDTVAIKQKFNVCKSRLDVSVKSEVIKDVVLEVPILSSNMSTVGSVELINNLNAAGGLGVMHRAWKNKTDYQLAVRAIVGEWVAASIGVQDSDYRLANDLISAGANILFIDIAHGFAQSVKDMLYYLKADFPEIKVVVGNVSTKEAIEWFCQDKIVPDAIKAGISNGFACSTGQTTACRPNQFSVSYECAMAAKPYNIPIIADGGCRSAADICLAIASGCSSVMLGSMFARCPESAGELVEDQEGLRYKIYFGMASEQSQKSWKSGLKLGTCAEGKSTKVPVGQSVEELVSRLGSALKSSITYGGGNNIKSFQDTVEFIELK